ncbi:MAG: GNAT family N-acetyltransferase [Bacteroidota bacterium]
MPHLQPLTPAGWQAAYDRARRPVVFAAPAYLAAAAEATGRTVERIGVFEGDTLQASVALVVRRLGPLRMAPVPPVTPFSAVLVEDSAGSPAVQALWAHVRERYASSALHLAPGVPPPAGTPAQILYTYRLDPAHAEPATWSSSARRLFRKHSAEFTFHARPSAVPAVLDLLELRYRAAGRDLPTGRPSLTHWAETLVHAGLARVYTVEQSGTIEAGLVALIGRDAAYYWLAGSRPGPAMTVLLGHLWPHLAEAGIDTFDFVGANTPALAEFKRRFGGRLVPYGRLVG